MTPWSPTGARRVADVLRSLWFFPSLMAVAGVVLGVAMPSVDALPAVQAAVHSGWLRTALDAAPAGAQQLLASGAGALATILGVAFSLTLVTLQLAAAQYTPRVVGRLLEDNKTRVVLGSYLGTVAYLLLVLRSVHGVGEGEPTFVPHLSLLLALALILGCLGLLAYFVHHLGESIEAARVAARVADRTILVLERSGDDAGEPVRVEDEVPSEEPARVLSRAHGYVQTVDLERLSRTLPRGTSVVRLDVAAGDYVIPLTPLVSLWPAGAPTAREIAALHGAFAIGPQRTVDHDVLFGIGQLVDVGLRALSPGVNDETTAVTIVNQLGAVLAAACREPARRAGWTRRRFRGVVILARSFTIRRLVEDAFAGMVRFSAGHPRVLARIVEVVAAVAAREPDGDARRAFVDVARWVVHAASREELAPHERQLLARRLADLRAPRVRGPAERPHAMH